MKKIEKEKVKEILIHKIIPFSFGFILGFLIVTFAIMFIDYDVSVVKRMAVYREEITYPNGNKVSNIHEKCVGYDIRIEKVK